ncbi:hypothetical protein AAC387_Pa04g1842 [Persea americana]
MDPNTRLDHALFQLTPTRTRCDLLVFSGGVCEKLASGLLDPFLSHLRFAKDQIAKGGYSITLRPDSLHAPWFTRSTLERFVRFVSTPEILERFASIEKEISHIESSIHLNDLSTSAAPNLNVIGQTEEGNTTAVDGITKKSIVPYKQLKGESSGSEVPQEENSKLRLQRVLETRKAVLRKEQAMAYARAFVAGFEEDHIDDLITFADAFGASRLREACMNFKEICKKKHGDGLWMDELAAIEACSQPDLSYLGTSGIVLASEQTLSQGNMLKVHANGVSNGQLEQNGSSDASTTNSTINHANSNTSEDNNLPTSSQSQIPISWPNLPPQYMYNFQGPAVPQMHPYQGRPFAGMQAVPLYYPGHSGNVQLPHMEESGYSAAHRPAHHWHHEKLLRRRDKSMSGKGGETPEPTSGNSDHGDSSSCSELDAEQQDFSSEGNPSTAKKQKKRTSKKSSRMVVIRNINYISSKRSEGDKDGISNESSVEDDLIDGDSIKQKVEDVVDSLQKHQKSTQRHSKRRSGRKHPNDANSNDPRSAENNSFEKGCDGNKRDDNWNAFQNLLMRDDESDSNETGHDKGSTSTKCNNEHLVDVQDEYCVIRSPELVQPSGTNCTFDAESKKGLIPQQVASDSFVVTERDVNIDDTGHLENFECDENYCKSLKRSNCTDGELLLSQRMESDSTAQDSLSSYTHESSSALKSHRGGDWFFITPERSADGKANAECSMFDGDQSLSISDNHLHSESSKKDFLIDDSFVVPTRISVDDQHDSQWRTDISIVTDLEPMGHRENVASDHSKGKHSLVEMYEPDDLYMVLGRDARIESVDPSWTPEIDYSMDISFIGADKRDSSAEANGHVESIDDNLPSRDKSGNSKNEGVPRTKSLSKDDRAKPLRGSIVKSRSEIIAKNKRPTAMSREAILKSKKDKEEENRKKMEELLIERQKRIAQRRTTSSTSPATSKNVKSESKTATLPSINDKKISRPPVHEVKRLNLHKSDVVSSTKERLSSGHAKNKGSTPQKTTEQKNIRKRGDHIVVNQSSEEKRKVQVDLSDSSAMKSFTTDQTSGLCTSADKRQNLSHGQLASLEDKPTTQRESRDLSANCYSDSIPISGLDVSDNKKEEVYCGQKEILSCNASVQSDGAFLHDSPSPLVANGTEKASCVETLSNKTCNQDFVSSSVPMVDQSAGLDSSKHPEVDYQISAAVPVATPRSSQVQEEKAAQYLSFSQANGCINDAFLASNSSQNHLIPINSEIKVSTSSGEKALNSADVGVEDENGTAHENFPVAYEISEIEIISDSIESTPPPINGMNSEPPFSRKKWTHNEGHPATKGIKKLLMFGRKSRNSAAC